MIEQQANNGLRYTNFHTTAVCSASRAALLTGRNHHRVGMGLIPQKLMSAEVPKALKEDRVEGFKIGGDDYVTKPFSIDELLLRIKAVLRRTKASPQREEEDGIYRLGALTFDARRQLLSGPKIAQNLTSRETELLRMLAARPNEPVGRSEILKKVWGEDTIFNGRSLDVFVSKLRKYLSADPALGIKSVHGKGYRLLVP